MKKLWGGRFKKKQDPRFEKFSSSLKWDWRLLPYDLKINRAHVKALKKCGVLSAGEAGRFLSAIAFLEKEVDQNTFRLPGNAEDVHSALQLELSKRLGPLADKLHTARSRNDLVAQSSRLYSKDHAKKILTLLTRLQSAIVSKAKASENVWVPGMTHLQNAQCVSQAHIFLAYAEMLERAKIRFAMVVELSDVCVLGSGAIGGVTFKLDQALIARELGLSRITANSYDVAGDRDYLLNLLSSITVVGTQLSRIAEDFLVAQASGEGVISIDEAFCTGSSMMPQKKNADVLELTRGAAGVFTGNLTGFLFILKGLPTSYNRDLQWDKKFLFESVELCEELLEIFTGVFLTLKINSGKAKMLVLDNNLYATDLADHLVRKGVPFKTAHDQVGQIVSFADEKKLAISKIGLDLLKKFAPRLDGSVYDLFNAENSVRLKKTIGSTHPDEIKKQIRRWEQRLRSRHA